MALELSKRPRSSHDVQKHSERDVDKTKRLQSSSSPVLFIDARSRQDEVAAKNSHSTAISSPFRPPSFPHDTVHTIDITDDTAAGHHLYGGLPSHCVLQREPGLYHSSDYGDESSVMLKRFPPVQQRKHVPVPATVLFARDAAPLHLPKLDKYLSSISPPRFSQQKGPFPPMGNLAKLGMSLDDLVNNRTQIPAWRNRNSILGSAANIILGLMVCSG
jgi:hypothetical protein